VIGELEIVLLGHAVTVQVRVERELAILLEKLRGVAPGAAVDTVELLSALLTIVAAATPTVIITIVIQGYVLKTPGWQTLLGSRRRMSLHHESHRASVIPTSAEPQLPRRDHLQMLE
jgi:hypothetical protein